MTDKARDLDPDLDPWDQQPGESPVAYGHFCAYRDAGRDRSLRRLAKAVNRTSTQLGRHSSEWRWPQRAAAWDADQDRRARDELAADRVKHRKRVVRIAEGMEQALASMTWELLKRVAQDPGLLEKMSLKELLYAQARAARAFPMVVQTDRLALGLSTDNVDLMDGRNAELEAMADKSDAELRAYLTGVDDGRAAEQADVKDPA